METNVTKAEVKNYAALDGLRVLGAAGIVLMHVQANGNYGLTGFVFSRLIPSFTDLVFLFMTVSAFSMCCGYYEKMINREVSLEAFYNKRFVKIWPLFACLSILELLVSRDIHSLQDAIANMTMCFGFLTDTGIEVIGVGWFLGLVFVFYYIFPFYCYLISKKSRAWLSLGVAVVLNVLCQVRFGVERTSIVYSGMFFIAGGIVFRYKDVLGPFAQKYSWLLAAAILLMASVYYILSANVYAALVLCVLILIYVLKPLKKHTLLSNPVMAWISGISLEIYLSHMVIFRVIELLGLHRLSSSAIVSYVLTAVMTLGGTVVFAVVAQRVLRWIGKKLVTKKEIASCPKN